MSLRDTGLRRALYRDDVVPSVDMSLEQPLTLRDQYSTGLCWMYAALGMCEALRLNETMAQRALKP